jgi:hypothetical protein
MPIVRREDHPVLIRGPGLPALQYLVDRASGSNAVTVLRNVRGLRTAGLEPGSRPGRSALGQ